MHFLTTFVIKYISSTNITDFLLLNIRINLNLQSDSFDKNLNENWRETHSILKKETEKNSRTKLQHWIHQQLFRKFSNG